MFNEYGLCISGFHLQKGPITIFTEDLKPEISQFITLKAMIVHGSFSDKYQNSQSVISFPEINKSAFIYFFVAPADDSKGREKLPFAISFLNNSPSPLKIYKDVDILESISKKVSSDLLKELPDKLENVPLSSNIISKVEESYNKAKNDVLNTFSSELKKQNTIEPNVKPDYAFCNQKIKNFDQAIYDIVIGNPVVILGDNEKDANLIYTSLKSFAPHRNLKSHPWSSFPLFGFDITATSISNKKEYNNVTFIDLNKKRVFGGRSCRFFRLLLNEIQNKNDKFTNLLINKRIDWLIQNATTLIKLEENPAQSKNSIKIFKENLDEDTRYIVSKLVELKSPIIYDRIGIHNDLNEIRSYF